MLLKEMFEMHDVKSAELSLRVQNFQIILVELTISVKIHPKKHNMFCIFMHNYEFWVKAKAKFEFCMVDLVQKHMHSSHFWHLAMN